MVKIVTKEPMMIKTIILPATLLMMLIAASCAPATNVGSEPEEISGAVSYTAITGFVNSAVSENPSGEITPSTADVEYTIVPELPAGLSIVRKTGEIAGTPEVASSESYVVTVSGKGNYTGSVVSNSFTIAISDKISIGGSMLVYADISGTINTALTESPTSTIPADADVEYTIDRELPERLTLNDDGSISGTPLAEFASTNYVVTATGTGNYTGSVESASFAIEVNKIPITGTISYANISGSINTALTERPTSTIPADASVKYTINRELPERLTLNSDGSISGTPSAEFDSAEYEVTATAEGNYVGMITSDSFTIEIGGPPITGTISYDDSSTDFGTPVSLSPTSTIASSFAVEYTIAPELPERLTLDSYGTISGTPNAFASMSFRVTVTGTGDYSGIVKSNSFTIEVKRITITGTITYADYEGKVNEPPISITPNVSIDPPQATIMFDFSVDSSRPVEFFIDSGRGVIISLGSPSVAFTTTRQVIVTANGNYQGTLTSDVFTITITDP